jgi:signal transduction histidine kinase
VTQAESIKQPSLWRQLRRIAYLSIRGKIVLPYLILTLLVILIGVYVVTSLVDASVSERLTNQLIEAGGVVSDSMALWEIGHLESARSIGFTVGLAEALQAGNTERVTALAQPTAAVRGVEFLVITDAQGQAVLHGLRQNDGTFEIIEEPFDTSGLWMVQSLIADGDPDGLPKRGMGLHVLQQRYYYFTAIPVGVDDEIVGVVVVGTSLDTLLDHFQDTSLANVTIYLDRGQAIGSTFAIGGPTGEVETLEELGISQELYQSILSSPNTVQGENVEDVRGRHYRIAWLPLRVGSDTLGVCSVALQTDFIVEQGATNRVVYFVIFATVMVGVIVVGYVISQRITNPISRLVRTSQAVAEGDLEQRTGIVSRDEIGTLAETFDIMTGRLAERTRALEETLGHMEAILGSIGDGVLLEDLKHNLIPLNAAAEGMVQEMSDEFLLGPLHELSAESSKDPSHQPTIWPEESRRFEVGKRVLAAHSAPVRTENGEHLGTVIVLRDVTAEDEADRLKDAFIDHVSHELRTPLTAIKGYSELMLIGATGEVSPEQHQFLTTIHYHTDNLMNMVNTLLDFTEMEAWDGLQLHQYPLELTTLVEEAVEPWRVEMERKELTFEVDIAESLPKVNADTKRLTWVVVNLVRNAWQYTPEGGRVTVRLYQQDGKLTLDVEDTGTGIAEEDLERLFSRFYRVGSDTQVRGIGLGLYIAKAIIEAHGGEIRVVSEEGVGSTFTVLLPPLQEE